ncbi:hypothetical protein BCR36DRAFT_586054 [Piromyces finnis]|uniref:Coth-domain-containing protein n=1 Tax=Piromyces finnis TaxID=1754191 RepID=A0A1Y1V0M5_9FUNG|nr:hypothetical protein BCR36DRAFT_586054 [Piromyces finnis]|eukprot:ORX44689.1 hypothetical protein BCR36DRAFT_586054 [Piromyces finnis]
MKIKRIALFFSTIFALGNAKNYNFKVVSLSGENYSIGVKYGNEIKPLFSDNFPLFTGTIEADNIDKYKYVVLDKSGVTIEEENIERTYSDESINEVFNRTNKKVEIPKLPEPFKRMFSMGSEKFKPFPNNVIYNVYAKCNETDYEYISNNAFIMDGDKKIRNDKHANCTITIISPDNVYRSTGSAYIFGFGSRAYKKFSWGMKLDKKFLGRKTIKFRAMASDPTLIREKLTTELYKSVYVPVQEGTYARLIINDDVYGLYTIMDSINKRWYKSYIHGDTKSKVGFGYKLFSSPPAGPYSDLKYLGDDYTLYDDVGTYKLDVYDEDTINIDDRVAQWKPLIEFTKMYDNWVKTYGNDNSDKAIDELKKFLNIENLLRLLAIETLVVSLDGFWYVMSNTAIYQNPQRNNYQFLPFDFDETLIGNKNDPLIDEETYKTDCITWATKNETSFEHYFTNNLFKHPQIKNRYDVILGKISRETFAPDKVRAFINSIADLIREDVQWNFDAIKTLDIDYEGGYINRFTYEEFEKNREYGHLDYQPDIRANDASFGVMEWVEMRGNSCKAYTSNVNLNDDKYISDDYEVEVPFSSASKNFIAKITLVTALSQLLIFFLI